MLSPEQLDTAGDAVAAVYSEIETQMLDRLVETLCEGDALQQKDLTALALLSQTHAKDLQTILDLNKGAISAAVRETVESTLRASDADDIRRLGEGEPMYPQQVTATIQGVAQILARDNIQMLEGAKQAFLTASTKAITQVNTGALTTERALHSAVRQLEREGIPIITYQNSRTGRVTVRNKVDVAVRRHIRTQIAQDGARLTMERLNSLDVALVEVSSHEGARPSHAEWQGRIYSLHGEVRMEDGTKYEDFYTATRYGSVDGLLGANCRHSFGPYRHGAPRAYEPDPKHQSGLSNDEVYEMTQTQRYLERQIRECKREVRGAQQVHDSMNTLESRAQLAKAQKRLKSAQSDMRGFIEESNAKSKTGKPILTRHPNREWAGDMPKSKTVQTSGRNLNEFLEGKSIKTQLQAKGVSASKASAAIKAELKARGLQPSDFETLKASEQQSLWQKIRATLTPSKGTAKPKGKHAEPFKRITGNHTMADDRAATNPHYDRKNPAYSRNCQRCVAAYEARRRGYDVEATARGGKDDRLPYMRDPQGWPQVFKDPKLEPCFSNTGANTQGKVEALMASYGDGARAIVRVQWRGTRNGHVFIAEQINGKTVFHDPQSNTADCSYYFASAKKNQTYCLRVDDREFTDLIFDCAREK